MAKRRIWIILAVAAVALGLAASWAFGSAMVRASPSDVPPARPPARDLRIVTQDGISLGATYWPGREAASPGILLLHGSESSRAAMADNAAWLAGQGYAALTVDLRGYGQSTPAEHSFGLYESRDAKAAFAWLKHRQQGAPVAVIGVSLGGAASLLGDGGPLPADALILQAVYPDIRHAIRNRIAALTATAPAYLLEPLLSFQSRPRFGAWPARLAPLAALRRYSGPVLVIGGGADRFTPPSETRAMFDAVRGPGSVWFARGADHAQVSGLESDTYRQRVLAFLRARIGTAEGPGKKRPK
jgi:alpha-beta hydrolase superfamily lysophospholipase